MAAGYFRRWALFLIPRIRENFQCLSERHQLISSFTCSPIWLTLTGRFTLVRAIKFNLSQKNNNNFAPGSLSYGSPQCFKCSFNHQACSVWNKPVTLLKGTSIVPIFLNIILDLNTKLFPFSTALPFTPAFLIGFPLETEGLKIQIQYGHI